MAVPAPNGPETQISGGQLSARPELDMVKKAAARLYCQGYARREIARVLVDHLSPNKERPMEQRLSNARNKLRSWERQTKFLDFIWQLGLLKTHLELPLILDGVAKKAKRGRVDAARLLLEVTGRHNPRGDTQATSVVIQFGDKIPRPHRRVDLDLDPIGEEEE